MWPTIIGLFGVGKALGPGFLSLPKLGASVLRCKGEELWRPCSPALLFASPPASTSTLSRPQLAGTALTSIEKESSRISAFFERESAAENVF